MIHHPDFKGNVGFGLLLFAALLLSCFIATSARAQVRFWIERLKEMGDEKWIELRSRSRLPVQQVARQARGLLGAIGLAGAGKADSSCKAVLFIVLRRCNLFMFMELLDNQTLSRA
ncbi:MAG: hypothetical protein ACRD2B_10925 [Terriglobia bacterium]